MGLAHGIGIGIPFKKKSSGSWQTYWATREPSGIVVTITGETTATVTWVDSALSGADGYKVYAGTTLKETIAVGVQTADITGLTANTSYTFKVVAYKGTNESTGITGTATTLEKWYLAGAVPAVNCKAAYAPKGAASLAASYVNLANPGTNNAAPGTAPTWDAVNGWKFNGTDQYLTTGVVPENDQTWSMIVKYSDYTTGDDCLAGIYHTELRAFGLVVYSSVNVRKYYNGQDQNLADTAASGIMGVAGVKKYFNGVDVGGADIVNGSGSITYDIYIGAIHYDSIVQFFDGNIQAVAIYDSVLTPAQVFAISTRMENVGTANEGLRKSYIEQEFGALVCLGMPTFSEVEDSDASLVNEDVNTFAPTDLDVNQWLDACVAAGMKYAILTAKGHIGLALWPTAYHVTGESPYSIAETTWYANNGNPDIVKLFVDGCRARDLKVGLYYSIWDVTYEFRAGTDETTDAAGYLAMIETQLSELLTSYGTIDCIWIDGWAWALGYEEISYATIYNYIKAIQPNCLVIENCHAHPTTTSEIELYEHAGDGHIPSGNLRYSEEVTTIRNDAHWYYHPLHDQTATALQTAASLNTDKLQCNARNGTYLLGITPGTDGHLPAAQVTTLQEIGAL